MLTWCLNNKYNKTIKEMIIIVALLLIIISVTVMMKALTKKVFHNPLQDLGVKIALPPVFLLEILQT